MADATIRAAREAAATATYHAPMPDGDSLSVLIHLSDYIHEGMTLDEQIGRINAICQTIADRAVSHFLRTPGLSAAVHALMQRPEAAGRTWCEVLAEAVERCGDE